jgi:hypothetical protein
MEYIYLFIYGSFNEAVSISDYTPSNGRRVNNELEGMQKEMVAELLSRHLPGDIEDSQRPG